MQRPKWQQEALDKSLNRQDFIGAFHPSIHGISEPGKVLSEDEQILIKSTDNSSEPK